MYRFSNKVLENLDWMHGRSGMMLLVKEGLKEDDHAGYQMEADITYQRGKIKGDKALVGMAVVVKKQRLCFVSGHMPSQGKIDGGPDARRLFLEMTLQKFSSPESNMKWHLCDSRFITGIVMYTFLVMLLLKSSIKLTWLYSFIE